MAARQWTLDQRQQQAEIIKLWQPWSSSTGAKTLQGKAISSRNAFKSGNRHQIKLLRNLIKAQKNFLSKVNV